MTPSLSVTIRPLPRTWARPGRPLGRVARAGRAAGAGSAILSPRHSAGASAGAAVLSAVRRHGKCGAPATGVHAPASRLKLRTEFSAAVGLGPALSLTTAVAPGAQHPGARNGG